MAPVMLELRCPQNVGGISVDPEPDWSFDSVLSELNTIEKKFNESPIPYTKPYTRDFSSVKVFEKSQRAFVMHLSDDEIEDAFGDRDEVHRQPLETSRRFAYISDSEDSENELVFEGEPCLMEKADVVEGALSELAHAHQLGVSEEVRNQISALEIDLRNRNKKFTSAIAHVEKNSESRKEMIKKFDLQFHRSVAEDLDKYLTGVQRKHEYRSQVEERRLRDDAAIEDAKRRQEEKLRQEKIKAEAEARLLAEKKKAAEEEEEEEEKALETERATKEAAEKVVTENSRKAAMVAATSEDAKAQSTGTRADESNQVSAGNCIKGAERALRNEERRSQIYNEVAAEIKRLGLRENKDFSSHERHIARRIKTVNGTRENVRTKADELIKLITQSTYPQASIAMFAEKVVSQCINPTGSFSNAVYAYSHVVVLVTSQVPRAMDILLAELNRVCMYTVPKYISYSKLAFQTEEAYYKTIGYQEEDGKIESTDTYIARVMSCMKLYGALVQTEVQGFRNLHGIEEGWAWIARFLNTLPANLYTAVALQAFLEMAGYVLYQRYKSQFRKLLNIISRNFLNALGGQRDDPRLTKVVMSIRNYIDSNQYLKEPEGWRLQGTLLSQQLAPELEYQQQRYHYSANRYNY